MGRAVNDTIKQVHAVRDNVARVLGHDVGQGAFDKRLAGLGNDPVLIIPGLTADKEMYYGGVDMLRTHGYYARAMDMRYHGFGAIEKDAQTLLAQVDELLEGARRDYGYTGNRVTLLGDSEGGLIARYAAQFEPGVLEKVGRIVTNGTPHGGIRLFGSDKLTGWAHRQKWVPTGARDLLTTSPVMRKLNDDFDDFILDARAVHPDFELHALGSRHQNRDHDILVPLHSALVRGPREYVRNYVVEGPHSMSLAFGNDATDSAKVLMAALGSNAAEHRSIAIDSAQRAQRFIAWRNSLPGVHVGSILQPTVNGTSPNVTPAEL